MSEKLPKIFYLLIGLALSFYLTNNVIEPILPIYITNLGASTLELGLIMSLASISSIIVRVPFGIMAEKMGRWRLILCALLLQSISFLLYSLVKNTTWFYPIRIIHALASTSFHPVALALAFELAPSGKSGDAMGRYLSTIGISMAIGPLISGLIIKYWEYNTLFFLTSLFPLCGLIIYVASPFRGVGSKSHSKKEIPMEKSSIKMIFRSKKILVVSMAHCTFAMAMGIFATLFPIYAKEDLLLPTTVIALLFTVRGFVNAISRYPSGMLSDRIGRKKPILIGYVLLTLSFLIISQINNLSILAIALAILGFSHAIRAVGEWTLVSESATSNIRVVSTAFVATVGDIARALGAILSGAMALVFYPSTIFGMAAIILFIGGLLIGFLRFE